MKGKGDFLHFLNLSPVAKGKAGILLGLAGGELGSLKADTTRAPALAPDMLAGRSLGSSSGWGGWGSSSASIECRAQPLGRGGGVTWPTQVTQKLPWPAGRGPGPQAESLPLPSRFHLPSG